jgi:hypothetical protein
VNTWFEETFEVTIAAATDGTQITEDLLNRTLMYIIYEYIEYCTADATFEIVCVSISKLESTVGELL